MLLRLRLLTISFASGIILFLILCLGAQNLSNKQSLNLGFDKSVEIPTGCLTGSCGACEIEVNGEIVRACITEYVYAL